jgi:hypothetical protein
MLQGCGGCSAQQISQVVTVLANPLTWVVALSVVTALLSKGKKVVKK